jgi:biopolymer transport protein ExbB
MSFLLMVIVFSIERFVVIGKASGTGSVDAFVRKIQAQL